MAVIKKIKDDSGTVKVQPQINRWSKRWLLFFWLVFLLLALGLVFTLLPVVTITIVPKTEVINFPVTIQVDLSLPKVLEKVGVVPGKLLNVADSTEQWQNQGYVVYHWKDYRVAVLSSYLQTAAQVLLNRSLPEDLLPLPEDPRISWGEFKAGYSDQVYNLSGVVTAKIYHRFPLSDWAGHLSGLSFTNAAVWLKSQVGVQDIIITGQPSFLAKIRQNIPLNAKLLKFRLDNGGKTSILQWHSQ